MKAKVYNMDGQIVGEVELPATLFESKVVPELVHEVVLGLQANRRVPAAHVKGRGEVRGGGRKPWRQKGTGRARHGSIRSPLWIGGGVTGHPRTSFTVKINRKMKQKATRMVLTDKAATEHLVILETLELSEPKTKNLVGILKKLPVGKSMLLVLPERNEAVLRASRNLQTVKTVTANALSLLDVLRYDTLLLPRATLPVLEELFGK